MYGWSARDSPDIVAGGAQLLSGGLRATFDLTGAAGGLWSVVATNADGSILRFEDAFNITAVSPFQWSENFDGTVDGWASTAITGSNTWSLSSTQAHSAPNSYFAPGPANRTTVALTSPSVAIPVGASEMQLRFRHSYNLESRRDGGRLEVSLDNGSTWLAIGTASGTAFAASGYNSTIQNGTQSDFSGGTSVWTGNSGGFIETVVNITDNARFAGRSVRFRWVLATSSSNASSGWSVDSIQLTGTAPVVQTDGQQPTITAEAATSSAETETENEVVYAVIRGTSTTVTVVASDDGGEGGLSYTWSATGGSVSFSPNGDNAARSTTANFSSAGDYTLTVTVVDGDGLSASSSVPVRVKQTATGTDLSPPSVSVAYGGTQQFAAVQRDQFGDELAIQPAFTWSVSGGGTISGSGFFSAGLVGGPYTVTAAAGSLSGTAQVSVAPATASVTLGSLTATYNGSANTVTVTTDPPDLAATVTYNGSASAPVDAGSYTVVVTVTDPNYTGSASGTLVIARAGQAITFGALPGKTFGDASFAVAATASSGLAVTYASSNTNVATVDGDIITIVGAGHTWITATQAGDANYQAAAPVEQILTVAKATATVTLGSLTQTYDGEPKAVTVTTDPPNLTVLVTYDGEAAPPTEAGSYAVVATIDEVNYGGSVSGTLVIEEDLPTFERWIGSFEGLTDATPAGDPDADGMSNAMEYFMGLDPTLDDAAGAVVQQVTADAVLFDYRRSKTLHGLTGAVKWSTAPGVTGVWSSDAVTDVHLLDEGTHEWRRASVPWTVGQGHLFLRIDLTMQ